jgi:hypothetical protein
MATEGVVCLPLAMAGCVLWTFQQDMELSLAEPELGLMTEPKLGTGRKMEESQCFPFRSRHWSFVGKAYLLSWGQATLHTTSC